MIEILLLVLIPLLLAWPLGHYMTGIFFGNAHASDRLFLPLENAIYRLSGINSARGMNWKSYGRAFLFSNLVLGLLAFILLLLQPWLPLNPDGIGPLSWDLGNYYVDLVRGVVRLLLPLAMVTALLLTAQGVPSTYNGAQKTAVLDAAGEFSEQTIPLGPVAAMVAIKQLGTNGGGWYGPNSANPLENPTPVSNAIETMSIVLIPMAVVFMAGGMLRRRGFTLMSLAAMGLLSALCIGASIYSEQLPNAAFAGLAAEGPNLEGKEVRFGADVSALWATLTTQTSSGSVNAMHDSLNPLAGLVTRAGMLVNAIWGGIGC